MTGRDLRRGATTAPLLRCLVAVLATTTLLVSGWAQATPGGDHAAVPSPRTSPTVAPTGPPMGSAIGRVAAHSAPAAPRSPLTAGAYNWLTGWWLYNGSDQYRVNGEGGAYLVDDRSNNQTIFGGLASGGLSNITSEYNATPYNWSQFDLYLPNSPSPRANMSYVSDDRQGVGVIFGGITDLATQAVSNETWAFDFPSERWVNETGGSSPSPRENAAMAADPGAGVALLEGGVDPSFRSGSSTGRALWNDTWQLNLSTWAWTRITLGNAPPPMFGSSMIFDPVDGRYYLFGGCGDTCTSSIWSYGVGDAAWTLVNTTGYLVPPRASSAFEWDATQDDATLFGGFTPGPNGPVALGDTAVFVPSTGRWTKLPVDSPPPPIYDLTVGEPEMNGCQGMFVWSGSNALNGPPPNAWLLQSPGSPWPNCFIPFLPNGTNPPPPTCPNATTALTVSVVDSATGRPVDAASVAFVGPCSPGTVVTDANGTVFLDVGPGIGWNLTVERSGYYPRELSYTAPFAPTASLTIPIRDLPFATVRCEAVGAFPPAIPLADVVVTLDESVVLGSCNATGVLGPVQLPFAGGTLTFTGDRPGFSGSNDSVPTPPDANVSATLTLRPSAPLSIEVVRAPDRAPVVGAYGLLSSGDPLAVAPIPFRTGIGGWFNVTVGAANFTVRAAAPGLATTLFGPSYHPWAVASVWTVVLGNPGGCNLTVELVDRATGEPIGGGSVSVAPNTTRTTGADGWARFAGLGPPGPAEVVGAAAGFGSASALVILADSGSLPAVVLKLDRIPACGGGAPCALTANGTPGAGFRLLPGGGLALAELAATPAALMAAAGAALVVRRVLRPPSGAERGASPSAGPSGDAGFL